MPEKTDRELLELAAKAAGERGRIQLRNYGGYAEDVLERADGTFWMPHLDDGDALRLAVRLNMTLTVMKAFCGAKPNYGGNGIDLPTLGEDKGAVLCRAIVMVAAEIGANMQS